MLYFIFPLNCDFYGIIKIKFNLHRKRRSLWSLFIYVFSCVSIFYVVSPLVFHVSHLVNKYCNLIQIEAIVGVIVWKLGLQLTTCAISYEFESGSWRGLFDTTLCDKVCQWLKASRWFSPGTLVSSTNKTDRHDITEILLKVVLTTINHIPD